MTPSRKPQPRLSAPLTPSRQLSIPFEAQVLRGMSPPECASVLTHLANLLQQAAGIRTGGLDDDEQ